MNDITLEELKAQLPADIATAINSVSLPANTTTAEFLNKILMGASRAALEKNTTLAVGERINSYGPPVFSNVQGNPSIGYFVNQSITLSNRLPVAFDEGSAVNA